MICLPKTTSPHRSNRRSRARTNPNRPWAVPAATQRTAGNDGPVLFTGSPLAAVLSFSFFKGV